MSFIYKLVNNSYCIVSKNELGIDSSQKIAVFCVYIPRDSAYNYHFVKGYGFDADSNLFVYFDGNIEATVAMMIYYIYV